MSDTTPAKRRTRTPKIRERTVTHPKNPEKTYQYYSVDLGMVDGKRQFRSFKTQTEAVAFVGSHQVRERKIGKDARALTNAKLRDAADALNIAGGDFSLRQAAEWAKELPLHKHTDAMTALEVLGDIATLEDAARYYITHRGPEGGSHTTGQVIDEYIKDGRENNLRDKSIEDLQVRLGRFAKSFGTRPICDVSRSEANEWLTNLRSYRDKTLSPLSKRHYRTVVGGLFNFAIEKDYVVENPFTQKSRRRRTKAIVDPRMPGILSAEEVERLLHTAQADYPSMAAPLAIACFGGLRTTEIQKLDFKHISLADRRITVPPEIAKRRRVRHVTISENLLAWLAPYQKLSGMIAPQNRAWRYRFDKVRKAAGIEKWPSNAMRHSFASYHLALHGNQNQTALELGHQSTGLLFDHYRGLAIKIDAEKYWCISPTEDGRVLRLDATA